MSLYLANFYHSNKFVFVGLSRFLSSFAQSFAVITANLTKSNGANVTLFYYLWHKFMKNLPTIGQKQFATT